MNWQFRKWVPAVATSIVSCAKTVLISKRKINKPMVFFTPVFIFILFNEDNAISKGAFLKLMRLYYPMDGLYSCLMIFTRIQQPVKSRPDAGGLAG